MTAEQSPTLESGAAPGVTSEFLANREKVLARTAQAIAPKIKASAIVETADEDNRDEE